MAKTLYFTSAGASIHRGDRSAKLNGTASGWNPLLMSEARGVDTGGTITATVTSVLGPTPGIELMAAPAATTPAEWITEPLSADFTISGTITLNLWAKEATLAANTAINAVIERVDARDGTLTQILLTARTTELTTTSVATNFTGTPTSTACRRGDRLRLRVFGDDAGTMSGSVIVTFNFDRSTSGVLGDSFVTFTENLTFEAVGDPTGSTYYLTDTAETINRGSATEKVASTTRGSGSVDSVTNTPTGPTTGIQLTDSGGGTAIEWYSPPLQAISFGGKAKFNIRAFQDSNAAEASLKAEIAVTAGDGTGAAVWGAADITAIFVGGSIGELVTTTDTAVVAWVAGDDTSITAGQRLRFRIYVDDDAQFAVTTGHTATVTYNGTSAAAAGDTYVILPQTVTEQVAAAVIPDVGMALTVT